MVPGICEEGDTQVFMSCARLCTHESKRAHNFFPLLETFSLFLEIYAICAPQAGKHSKAPHSLGFSCGKTDTVFELFVSVGF